MSELVRSGMTPKQAKIIEYTIIGACVFSLVCIFQPFSKMLFSIGCIGVVIAGLSFNLIPFCRPGVPISKVVKVAIIVMVIFAIAVALALVSAWLYGVYLSSSS